MVGPRFVLVTVLSFAPLILFAFAPILEHGLSGLGWDRQQLGQAADAMRLSAGLLVLAMVIYFGVHLHQLDDPKIDAEKRSVWTWILLLGNIFAIPVVWYIFILRRGKPGAS